MRRWTSVAFLFLLCNTTLFVSARRVHGQAAVIDAANLLENTVTALQTTYTVANQVLELTQVGQVIVEAGQYANDLENLAVIVREARGLSYDITLLQSQVQQLFALQNAPRSASELQRRLAAMRQASFEAYVYALRTQTLLTTAQRTIQHLTQLVASITALIGHMQANQTTAQFDGTLSQTVLQLQIQMLAFQRAVSVQQLAEPVTMESLSNINEEVMQDHPQ